MQEEILLIDKPSGISTYDIIRRIKKDIYSKYGKIKIGHAGTLDPFATGLVIILLGKGTKLFDLFRELSKTYRFTLTVGEATDTLDSTGTIIERAEYKPNWKEILIKNIQEEKYLGEQDQSIPKFSAKKLKGVRAYKLARAGNTDFDTGRKTINIYDLSYTTQADEPINQVSLEVRCSSGTYIRQLAYDLAKSVGTVGYCSSLRRTHIGEHSVDEVKILTTSIL